MSALSPLERMRVSHEARKSARRPVYVDLMPDGALVAEIGPPDTAGARDTMRTFLRLMRDDVGDLTEHDLASVIVSATRRLHARGDDGALEPMVDENGDPMTLASIGAALGLDEVRTPIDCVRLVFTEGDPPAVNASRLLRVAMEIASYEEADAPGT